MAIEVTVPRLGWSMDEGTLVEWFKREGDFVRKGEMLFSLEGDKATQEIESFDEGFLRFVPDSAKPGDAVKVGQVLAYLLAEGEPLPTRPIVRANSPTSAEQTRPVSSHATVPQPTVRTQAVSPRARRAARNLAVDIDSVTGTGRNGRVRERDVLVTFESRSQSKPDVPEQPGKIIPLTPLRRTIAMRMAAACQQTAPVTLTTQADATNLVALRKSWRQARSTGGGLVPGHTDMIVKLVATALEKHPLLQAQWRAEGLFIPDAIHIGIAVDTEAGLMVPVLRNVPALSISQIAVATRELIDLARSRRLTPEQTQSGTFTVTSLGSLGIDAFTPIINLPQSAILGIGRISLEPAVVGGEVVPRHRMWLSITFDHRVSDGAPAARFLSAVRDLIELADIER
jgi:pyruvate dehydrogenase E2 component (dihydrolipoamide acetyltransferase)